MHWRSTFRAALFEAWAAAGLPDPEPHLERYRRRVADVPCPLDLPYTPSGPLARGVVDRVHGFGAVLGEVLGDLQGAEGAHDADGAAWCGRFNLAISLVDYVCDESGRMDALGSLPPFRELSGSDSAPPDDLRDEERTVAALATGLISDLGALPATGVDWRGRIAELYRAEVAIATAGVDGAGGSGTGVGVDLAAIRRDLAAKSCDPFALMAARMAASGSRPAEPALGLGRAVGGLFWLVDDAVDLWLDLSAGSWNLFLVRVAEVEPGLLGAPDSPFRDAAIGRALQARDVARWESRAAVEALVAALADAGTGPESQKDGLGLLAAALAVW